MRELSERSLAPYAATAAASPGRAQPETAPSFRTEFQRDRDRIIHSASFRRLEYKTQVFVNHEGDLFRTRLTHSVEVAQIARTIARALRLNEELTEAVALAHDLGHTPFGHAGQDALNNCMKAYGGFEHNLQSLRVVDQLEERYAEFDGLNLMFETREGILKHCSIKHAETLGDVGKRFIDKTQPSLEAQLTNLADEIAYNSHDVDDGLRSGLISLEQLLECTIIAEPYERLRQQYPDIPERRIIYEIVRDLIGSQVVDLVETSQQRLENVQPASIHEVRQQPEAIIAFSEAMREKNLALKRFLRNNLYRHYRVHRMTAKAVRVIQSLFAAFLDDTRLLPAQTQAAVQRLEAEQGEPGRARGVADYIAGMTDRYAITEYERVFNPKELT